MKQTCEHAIASRNGDRYRIQTEPGCFADDLLRDSPYTDLTLHLRSLEHL